MDKNCLPPTTKKAALNTCNRVNQKIRNKTIGCINTFKDSEEEVLSEIIEKLDYEWDTERVLETNAASAILLGSVAGFARKRCCWFLLTGTVGFFLLQHALEGWCPPLPVIRKMGVRTAEEIYHEKTAFKIIRGDFLQESDDAEELLRMAEKE